MRKHFLFALFICCGIGLSHAQNSTAEYVYGVMQTYCTNCHSNASPAGNLDLEGAGTNQTQRMANVFNNLVNKVPDNSFAASQGYKIVDPGNVWRSSLFRKINAGLQTDMVLDPAEGDPHTGVDHTISDPEKEAIRQWVLYGAPAAGNVIDLTVLARYYSGQAVPSFTTPPPPPNPGEGFQIHLGPFFVEEEGEVEYFWKYPTQLPADLEVHKVEALFGLYSHHAILYRFNSPQAAPSTNGLRLFNAHTDVELVTAHQFPDTISLPEGSAFFWKAGDVLDLNTHYINYSSDKVAACEVYFNIYTQTKGTAAQEMKVALPSDQWGRYIPNNGQTYTYESTIGNPGPEIFIWSISSHTHKLGTDFNIFTRDIFGNRNDLIFDAEYMNGDPTSFFIGYDYQHPPTRYFNDFLPIKTGEGLVYEASYVNNGPAPVQFAGTSDDEMMVMLFSYLEDTAGVSNGPGTAIDKELYAEVQTQVRPNPFSDYALLTIENLPLSVTSFQICDLAGSVVQAPQSVRLWPNRSNTVRIERKGLAAGVYLFQLTDEKGQLVRSGKLFIQ